MMRPARLLTWTFAGLMVLTALAPAAPAGNGDPPVSGAARYDDHPVIRVDLASIRELRSVLAVGARPWSCRVGLGEGEFLVSPEQLRQIDEIGIEHTVLINNVQALIDAERERIAEIRTSPLGDEWFSVYRTWTEVNDYIDELVDLRPDLAEKMLLGHSHEGREIYGMRITSPEGENKPAALFNGCQHAREWISVMVPMYIADRLVRDYDTDPQVKALVDRVEFFIVPIVNPDGYVFSHDDDDGDRMWRKNRRDNEGSSCYGVDLNRNWDADWAGPHSTSTNPCSDIYIGPGNMSEPETQVMAAFIESRPQLVAHIDYHNFSELILQPLGFTLDDVPEYGLIDELGSQMRDEIFNVHGVDYPNGKPGELLYFASGIFPDWSYLEFGIFGYTVELRPASLWDGGFLLPPEQIIPTGEENFPAAMRMAEWAARGVEFTYPDGGPPVTVHPGGAVFDVEITQLMSAPLDTESGRVLYRFDEDEPFAEAPLTHVDGAQYQAELPAPAGECGSTVEYVLEIASVTGPVYRDPWMAFDEVHVAELVGDPACPADLTCTGGVGVNDLLVLIGNWGACPDGGECPGDLTGSGSVGVDDLLELIGAWGACPE